MPTYEHLCQKCNHEWEDFYSIKAKPPSVCPNCETEGMVKRLISGGAGKGIVVLTGHDLKQKLTSDAKAAQKRASTDENYRANILGESNYHQQQLQKDSVTKELTKIGQDASKIKSISSKKSIIKRST